MKKTIVACSVMTLSLVAGFAQAQDASQPPKAEPNMQKVLDALTSLGGKPIETLTPEETR